MNRDDRNPSMALPAWGLADADAEEIQAGHINRTWRVTQGEARFALQWLNPIFAPEVHSDIEAITTRLVDRGLVSPRLVPTPAGDLWVTDLDGGVWRLFTWVEGRTLLAADSASRCAQAGTLLGAFHSALWDLEHTYHFGRLGVHETPAHLAALETALVVHAGHVQIGPVRVLAEAILAGLDGLDLGLAARLPKRHVHGDPKISNFLFGSDQALCLVDLDTLARMPIAVELGDAFRSWCNPGGEDAPVDFRVDHFEAGLTAYAQTIGDRPTIAEREAIPAMTEIIALELAARFCADALNESYFGWDSSRFPSASAHNQARTRSQIELARAIRTRRSDLERIARAAWG